MFYTLINWKTGCSFNLNFKALLNATENPYLETKLLKNENSILIQNNYITIFESEILIGDYYLELTNDTLLSFLEDEINSSRKINYIPLVSY